MRTVFGDVVIPQVLPTATGKYDPRVEALQKELKAQGFDPGPFDGVMGPRTQAAVNARNTANAQRMTDAAAVQAATLASHAQAGTEPTPSSTGPTAQQVTAAKQAVDAAKVKVAAASSQPEKAVAVKQLEVAEMNLAAVDPGMPTWQKIAIGGGAAAIGLGLFLALRRK